MILDFEKYMPYLDEFDLSQDQKLALIKTVWGIMESQVDQAFGFHPVQQVYDRKEASPLHSLAKNNGSNLTTVSTHFWDASKNSANDNKHESAKKVS